jgi:FemAB-related protein (PEP-CTERM system-associated)
MDRWNKIVEESEDGKIYHLDQWGKLLSRVHGHKLIYLEEEKGVFPLALVKSFIFGDRLISLPFADYGGPCAVDYSGAEKLIRRADEEAKNLKVDFLEVRTPSEKYFSLFEKLGFKKRDNDYLSFIVDLSPDLETIWKNIGLKNRNMVKRAEIGGVKVREVMGRSDLKLFYSLYSKTMKRLGSPPQSYDFFREILQELSPNKVVILLAGVGEKVIAGGLFFLYKDTVHHAYSCSLRDGFVPGTNNLICWQAIRLAKNRGLKSLDLGRTRLGAGNLAFKQEWGGKRVSQPYFYKFYRKELKERQEIRYKKLSGIWAKFLPEFLARMIGPWLIKQIG